jgi:hypothetical protein
LRGTSTSDVFGFSEAERNGVRLGSGGIRSVTASKTPVTFAAPTDPRTGEWAFGTIRLRMVVEDVAGNRTRSSWFDVVATRGSFSAPPSFPQP